jgi:hypothetical protein
MTAERIEAGTKAITPDILQEGTVLLGVGNFGHRDNGARIRERVKVTMLEPGHGFEVEKDYSKGKKPNATISLHIQVDGDPYILTDSNDVIYTLTPR